jgi:hypothetical protein
MEPIGVKSQSAESNYAQHGQPATGRFCEKKARLQRMLSSFIRWCSPLSSLLRNEWVTVTLALVAMVAVLPMALVSLGRGQWLHAAITAAMVVLAFRVGNGAR